MVVDDGNGFRKLTVMRQTALYKWNPRRNSWNLWYHPHGPRSEGHHMPDGWRNRDERRRVPNQVAGLPSWEIPDTNFLWTHPGVDTSNPPVVQFLA